MLIRYEKERKKLGLNECEGENIGSIINTLFIFYYFNFVFNYFITMMPHLGTPKFPIISVQWKNNTATYTDLPLLLRVHKNHLPSLIVQVHHSRSAIRLCWFYIRERSSSTK